MVVLDASVILKWMLFEKDRDTALKFLDKHISGQEQIAIPELLYYEVGNILSVKAKLLDNEIIEAMNYLFDLELSEFSLGRDEYIEAIKISRLYKLSVYDASYVALANSLNAYFVTADKKLAQKIENLPFVQNLEIYQDQ